MKTDEIFSEIKAYEQMCQAGKAATLYFLQQAEMNPALVAATSFRLRDIRDCHGDLENTYLIRVFAVFEVRLRQYWQACGKKSYPKMSTLLDRIASRQHVQMGILDHAHAVRAYRNSLVHGGQAKPLTLSEARSHLCLFLANLPREW